MHLKLRPTDYLKISTVILAVIVSVYWTFFAGSPPKTTIGGSILWMTPPFLSIGLAIPVLVAQENKSDDLDIDPEAKLLDFAISLTASGTFILIIGDTLWSICNALAAGLKPFDPDSDDQKAGAEWGPAFLALVLALIVAAFVIAGALQPTIKCWRDWTSSLRVSQNEAQALQMEDRDSQC